jgi:hypothetical protein
MELYIMHLDIKLGKKHIQLYKTKICRHTYTGATIIVHKYMTYGGQYNYKISNEIQT